MDKQCGAQNVEETADGKSYRQAEPENADAGGAKKQTDERDRSSDFSFEHLKDISNEKLKKLLKDIDAENLAYALRDAGEDIRDRVLPNLTKSARQEYDQMMEKMKKIKKEDIARGREKIAQAFSRLFNS
ncbi:MAG TPA: FliG C-terminal domain-containing protein [Bacteroidales bacterium]|nr:FliG C-terminal domain-containing protein [Bacteroidales bacterium]